MKVILCLETKRVFNISIIYVGCHKIYACVNQTIIYDEKIIVDGWNKMKKVL